MSNNLTSTVLINMANEPRLGTAAAATRFGPEWLRARGLEHGASRFYTIEVPELS